MHLCCRLLEFFNANSWKFCSFTFTMYRKGCWTWISLIDYVWLIIYWKWACLWFLLDSSWIWISKENTSIANFKRTNGSFAFIDKIFWWWWKIRQLLFMHYGIQVFCKLLNRRRLCPHDTRPFLGWHLWLPDIGLSWTWKWEMGKALPVKLWGVDE